MSLHFPENHHLRKFYRTLAFLAGLFVLVFGIVGLLTTQGSPMFEIGDDRALGLRTNPGFSLLSVGVGVLVLLATFIGRNMDRFIYLWAGYGFMAAGLAMMLLMGKGATNYLNFTIATCVLSFVIGSVLVTAGMYVKAGRA